jgi:hypothetical protein
MMNSWLHHIALMAKVRTGFGGQIIVCYLIAAVSLVAAFVFLSVAGFVWLADRFDELAAALILGGGFLLIAIIAVIAAALARRRNIERARLELAARRSANWLDPKLVAAGLEIGKTLGWRRIATLAAVGVLAAGLTREWLGAGGSSETGDGGQTTDGGSG